MKTDIEIAQECTMAPIGEVAKKLDISEDCLENKGSTKAKLDVTKLPNVGKKGKLILLTAINPTPAVEGKTTTSIGLADSLAYLQKRVCLFLR